MCPQENNLNGEELADFATVKTERNDLIKEGWEHHTEHPWNWNNRKRWRNALIISVTGFLTSTGSSIFVSCGPQISSEFHETNEQVITLTTALFVLGLGFGPFVFAPISELWGRQIAYTTSLTGWTILSLGCAFAPNLPSLIVMRFLAGFFGSVGPGLGVATISDLFRPHERGVPVSVYAIGPMMGPVLGSLIGNYLAIVGWRWTFRFMAIAVGLNTCSVILLMNETYAPVVRRRLEARGIVKPTRPTMKESLTPSAEVKSVFVRTFTRPPRLLMNPVCAIFVTYYAYVYVVFFLPKPSSELLTDQHLVPIQSIIYVFLVSLPLLFSKHTPPLSLFSYNWPKGTAGLCYLGLGVGFLAAALIAALAQDRIYKYCSKRYNDEGRPEYRLVITQLGMIVFPIGLLVWGWTAQAHTHFMGPIVGSAIFACGIMLSFTTIQNWIVDAFFPYSAAALAAAALLRSATGCVLPIFADPLFKNLGYGWGGTLLALVSLPAIPAPLILFLFGKQLRERFRFEP